MVLTLLVKNARRVDQYAEQLLTVLHAFIAVFAVACSINQDFLAVEHDTGGNSFLEATLSVLSNY